MRSSPAAARPEPFVPRASSGKPPAPLSRLFDPLALKPPAFLRAIEQRIERCDVKAQRAFGAPLDRFADFVTVPRPVPRPARGSTARHFPSSTQGRAQENLYVT